MYGSAADNPTDWGLPAIHFIADFSWHREIREQVDPPSPGFIYRDSILRKAYLGIANAYARPSGRDVLRDDVVIANSRWTANLSSRFVAWDCAAVCTLRLDLSSLMSHGRRKGRGVRHDRAHCSREESRRGNCHPLEAVRRGPCTSAPHLRAHRRRYLQAAYRSASEKPLACIIQRGR